MTGFLFDTVLTNTYITNIKDIKVELEILSSLKTNNVKMIEIKKQL